MPDPWICQVACLQSQDCLTVTAFKVSIKVAATDVRYSARSKFSRSLVHKKSFMSSSFQVRIGTLSREVGYLLWVWINKLGEKLKTTMILGKFKNKP